VVLYFLAKHFRSENVPCTMRKLEHMAHAWLRSQNQLLPTLCDLKELGILKIQYNRISKERKTISDFIDMKQLTEEHITLKTTYDRIIYALQKEDLSALSKNSFRMDLNF
jgi:predicted ATPase with chaperone activity